MTALLLALTLAAPVPKPTPPPPCGFRDGQRLVYSHTGFVNGLPQPPVSSVETAARVRATAGEEVFRRTVQHRWTTDAPAESFVLVSRAGVRPADATGRPTDGQPAAPRGGWWRAAAVGDVRDEPNSGGAVNRCRYQGAERVVVPAGEFRCAKVRTEVVNTAGKVLSAWTQWHSLADGVLVRTELDDPLGRLVAVDELVEFTRGR